MRIWDLIKKLEGSCEEKSKKDQTALVTAIVISVSVISGTGLINMGFGNNDYSFRSYSHQNTPKTSHFINNDTRIQVVDLGGDWKFALGDDPARSEQNFDDSQWQEIAVSTKWEDEGFSGYDGFAWYRRSFDVALDDVGKPMFAMLGRIDDVDEVFINGRKIGGLGRFHPNYLTAWNRDRVYRIPEGLLSAGEENVISVRVYDEQHTGGLVGESIGLYTTELPQPVVDLSGEWLFQTGDRVEWSFEEVDESGFSSIQVPALWDLEGYLHYDGHAWYRTHFKADSVSGNEELVLVLGMIDDTDEVYLNGELIGNTGNLDASDRVNNVDYYRMNREYSFSSSLLKDVNTLAVRIHDDMGGGGIYSGPVGIMRADDLVEFKDQVEEASKVGFAEVWDWLMGRR